MKQLIPINEIVIPPRQREDLGDLSGLQDSIRRIGVIQPLVLDENHNLIAGERRYRACRQLGLDSVPYVTSGQIPDDVKAEMEFEENFWRKSMTWQEEALGVLKIYRQKKRQGIIEGWSANWQLIIAEMFKMSVGNVNYILAVAKKLEDEKKLPEDRRRYWNFTSVAEAFRLGILAEKEDEQNQLLAKAETFRTSTSVQRNSDQELIKHVEEVTSKPDALAFERERYNSNPLNTIPFEKYWEEKVRLAEEAKNTIYLSNRFIHCDCITFMNDPDRVGVYDHIITDPPYAIDMDNLQQQNQNGGMNLPGVVEDAHQVEENIQLLKNFFPAAFKCTKDKAYVVVFCDLMMWQFLYDQATAAGFSVQRWPVIWRKVGQSVMNNCAQVNTAKDYEPILICHKPGATLATRSNTSFIDGSNVEAKKVTGHPFAKPFEVTKALVQMVSGEGQTILEPFAGGGSIVLEMLRQKRNVIALNKHEDEYNRMLENVKREYYLKLNPKYVFK